MGCNGGTETIEVQRGVIELVCLGRTTQYLSDTIGVSVAQISEWLDQAAGQDGMSPDRIGLVARGDILALRHEISAMRRRCDVLRVMHAMKVGGPPDACSRAPVTISIRSMLSAFRRNEMQD